MMTETNQNRDHTIHILYIEDNEMDVEFVRSQFRNIPDFSLETVDRFQPGLKRASKGDIDVVLLDLNLPDSPGALNTFITARDQIPLDIPIVVYTSIDDEEMGLSAVKRGAQNYLVKGHTDGHVLVNALRHSVERSGDDAFFRTVVFSGVGPVVVVDWKGTVRLVNPAAEELFARSAEDWVGRVFGYPLDPDHPQDITLPNGARVQMDVAETELQDEVHHIIHFRTGNRG